MVFKKDKNCVIKDLLIVKYKQVRMTKNNHIVIYISDSAIYTYKAMLKFYKILFNPICICHLFLFLDNDWAAERKH